MDNRQLACKIASYLFTNGSGAHAQRLVLELPNLKDGGGWCESAVADVIEDHLNDASVQAPRSRDVTTGKGRSERKLWTL